MPRKAATFLFIFLLITQNYSILGTQIASDLHISTKIYKFLILKLNFNTFQTADKQIITINNLKILFI